MRVEIFPARPDGSVAAPPSKSMAHRLLICACLAEGGSEVRNVACSQDVLATLDCLSALGAQIVREGDAVRVRGADPRLASGALLPCRESGSTLRFLAPLCLLSGAEKRLTGTEKLLSRPLSVYADLCRSQGLRFLQDRSSLTLAGTLTPGEYRFPGNISSQFVSGLLFALPLLPGDSRIVLEPPVESRSYIDMTRAALRAFGVRAEWTEETVLSVPGGQRPVPQCVTVEGDWSNAAFFLALGLPVTGLREDSLQGDRVCVEYLRRLEAGAATLDLSDCPDLGPVLMAAAALRQGARFTGTGRLRLKESDRGAAMAEELGKFGVAVRISENEITVGSGAHAPADVLDGHNDHRIVMALSVLCCAVGGTITGAEAVRKSFPDFFTRLRAAGGKVEFPDGMDQ